MAINEELTAFLKQGLERGLSRGELENVLLETGWPSDQVRGALDGFADADFPIPVPRPKPYVSARETFIYLVLFSAMYVSAFSLGSLIFQLINQALPDPSVDAASALEVSRDVVRWSISWLVVTLPVFAIVARSNHRAVRADPSRRLSKVRRWLTYLTLFVAVAVLVGDVVTIVYNVLSGELTTRFILKVVTVAAISSGVLAYLAFGLGTEEAPPEPGPTTGADG